MNTSHKKTKILASIGLLGASVIWGISFVIVKTALDIIPMMYMLAFRFTIATAVLSLIFWKKLKELNKKVILEGLILGTLLFICYVFQTEGCKYTTAGKNAFLTTVYIVIVPFLYWAISKKRPNIYSFIAAFIALVGIGLLSLQGDLTINIGDILTLVAGFVFAGHLVATSRFTEKSDPILLTVVQMFFTALYAWLGSFLVNDSLGVIEFSSDLVMALLYLGVLSSAMGFLLQTMSQKYIAPSIAGLLMATESVFGLLTSVIVMGEVVTIRAMVGCVLILLAVVIAETKLGFLFARKARHEDKRRQK